MKLFASCGVLLVLAIGCKTPSANVDSQIKDDDALESGSFITIKDWGYSVDNEVLKQVAKRVGCKEAAKWVSVPRNGDLKRTVNQAANEANMYDFLEVELFGHQHVEQACERLRPGSGSDKLTGIKKLLDRLKAKGYGLTIMMNGGFGSHLTADGAFIDSRKRWADEFNGGEFESADFRIVRHECLPNSYDTDNDCAPKLVERFQELQASLPEGKKHRYLLLGYSKGGTSSTHALGISQELRDNVLAVITFGSPLGGGIATNPFYPLIAQIADQYNQLPEDQRMAIGYILQMGAGTFERPDDPTFKRKLDLVLAPGAFDLLKRGFNSLLPTQRKRFMEQTVRNWDYSKSATDPITGKNGATVFHVAAISDLGAFSPLPTLTVNDRGHITTKKDSMISAHTTELVFLNEFRNHPLNDTCVALEHAVIPQEYKPRNSDISLLALLKIDHFNIGLSPVGTPSPLNIPGEEILDAIIEAATDKLTGGAL